MADVVGSIKYDASIDTTELKSSAAVAESIARKTSTNIETHGNTSFKNFASSAASSFEGVANTIAKFAIVTSAALTGGALGISKFIQDASELQGVRASFESMTGTAEDATKVMQQLNKFSFSTAFSTSDINQTARLFLGAGIEVDKLLTIMSQVGDVAGATGADLKGLALPISQAIAAGKLQTQDWYQILNQGGGVFKKYIINALGAGHSTQTFADDLSNGAINAEVLQKALALATQEGGAAFQGAIKQSQTFNGRMSNLQETISGVALEILGVDKASGQVDPSGLFAKLSTAVEDATEWLAKNKDTIKDVVNTIIDNAFPVLGGLATAYGVATTAATLFSIAASANPFGIIAIAIATLVGGLMYLELKFGIFSDAFNGMKEKLQPTFDWFMQNVWPQLQEFGKFIGEQFKAAWDDLNDAFKRISDSLSIMGIDFGTFAGVLILIITGPIALFLVALITTVTAIARLIGWIAQLIAWGAEMARKWGEAGNDMLRVTNDKIGQVIGIFSSLLGRVNQALGDPAGYLYGFGKYMIQGMINGINDAIGGLKKVAQNAANVIPDTVKKALGIHSPSRVMMQMGNYMMQGMAIGISDGSSMAVRSATMASNDLIGAFDTSISRTPSVDLAASYGSGSSAGIQQINHIHNDIDLNAASQELAYQMDRGRS